MDAVDQLNQDVRDGRIDVDRLIDVIVSLQRQLEAAKQRIAELEMKIGGGGGAGSTAKVAEPFSMRAEEKRQRARTNKLKLSRRGRRGRLNSADKIKLAERTEACYPDGVPPEECHLSHTRPVWRLRD